MAAIVFICTLGLLENPFPYYGQTSVRAKAGTSVPTRSAQNGEVSRIIAMIYGGDDSNNPSYIVFLSPNGNIRKFAPSTGNTDAPEKYYFSALLNFVSKSPDGRLVAWLEFSSNKTQVSLMVASPSGLNQHSIGTVKVAEGGLFFPVAWSPDSRRILLRIL